MTNTNQYGELFMQEADELLQNIEEILLQLEETPTDEDLINQLFRAFHTIKGSGSMFGYDHVAQFTHHVETLLDSIRNHEVTLNKNLLESILLSRDFIVELLNSDNPQLLLRLPQTEVLIKALNTSKHKQDEASTVEKKADDNVETLTKDSQEETASSIKTYRILFTPEDDFFDGGLDPIFILEELEELGSLQAKINTEALPQWDHFDPEKLYLKWELTLETEEDENRIHDAFVFVDNPECIHIETLTKDIEAEEAKDIDLPQAAIGQTQSTPSQAPANISEMAKKASESGKQIKAQNSTVRVAAEKLDQLINLVGEIVITQARITQVSNQLNDIDLSNPVEEMERLTGELRDNVLNIRMMPIGSTFSRFNRLIRDLSKSLGKNVKLLTQGADTELDKTVIEKLSDPLIHLIRNSLDHGLELPQERAEAGKEGPGIISLKAAHQGANVVISIEDDGKGIDPEIIRGKAITQGLISPEQELSQKEIFNLIFQPGFSTAQTVTQVSGRGVGMDVVKKEIEALRGRIDIQSELGSGTTIELLLPLTLAIIDGLLIQLGDDKYVIPVSLVEECLELSTESYALSKNRNIINVRGEMVPIVSLRNVFGDTGERPEFENIIIVHVENKLVGIVCDRVIGDYQTVIKSLGKVYKNAHMFSGSTIMGDGKVALILDIPHIVREAQEQETTALSL